MESSYHIDVLRGRCQELPEARSKLVRVFISSTFSGRRSDIVLNQIIFSGRIDTSTERDSLIESVFPRLKEYCRAKYGLEFQVSGNNYFRLLIVYFIYYSIQI